MVNVSYPRALVLLVSLLALTACTEKITEPGATPEPEPAPTPAPLPLGLYDIQLTGFDGAEGAFKASTAVAVADGPSSAVSPVTPAASLNIEVVSSSSFTDGARGQGGQRYVSVTYRVRNMTGTNLSNVTFIPVVRAPTIGTTPFTSITVFNGTNAAPAVADQMVPTGASFLGEDNTLRARYTDVLQAYTEAEVAAITPLPAGTSGIMPYGFVVSNAAAGNRDLPTVTDVNAWDGTVTFAFRYPLQATVAADPFLVAFRVLAVQDTETRLTESMEEAQDTSAVRRLRERAAALSATTVTVLNGSAAAAPDVADYPGQRQLCSVRTAGTPATPTRFINAPGAYAQVALLYPGETMNSCAAYFRSGTPARPATNVPFTVTAKAVDRYGNVVTTAADSIVLRTASGPPATLGPKLALVSGSVSLPVTYTDYGTSALSGVGRRNDGTRSLLVAGVTRTWTAGAGTTDWNNGANWSPAAVPMTLDSVLVPVAAPLDPVLSSNVTVMGVTVEDVATLALGAFDLTAGDDVSAGLTGGITNTSGRLVLAAAVAGQVQGRLPRLRVTGRYSLTGNVTARAPLQVEGGNLTDGTYRLQIESN